MPAIPRPLALVVLLALVLTGCGAVGSSTDDGCAEVQVVGVRGQSQSLQKHGGLGKEVDQVVTALEEDLADRQVDGVAVEALRHRSRDSSDLDAYDADVSDARDQLDAVLRTRVEECPDAKLVVVGFSQGAQIAQETLAASPGLARRVDALALLGNPRHDPDSGFTQLDVPGPAPTRAGSLGAGPDLGALDDRTVEACLSRDVVCDADGGTDYTVHKTGYEDLAISRVVAEALVSVLTR